MSNGQEGRVPGNLLTTAMLCVAKLAVLRQLAAEGESADPLLVPSPSLGRRESHRALAIASRLRRTPMSPRCIRCCNRCSPIPSTHRIPRPFSLCSCMLCATRVCLRHSVPNPLRLQVPQTWQEVDDQTTLLELVRGRSEWVVHTACSEELWSTRLPNEKARAAPSSAIARHICLLKPLAAAGTCRHYSTPETAFRSAVVGQLHSPLRISKPQPNRTQTSCDDKRLSLQLKWRLCLKPCAKLPAVMMWEPPIGWSLNPLGIRTWEPESNRNTLGSLKMYAQHSAASIAPRRWVVHSASDGSIVLATC